MKTFPLKLVSPSGKWGQFALIMVPVCALIYFLSPDRTEALWVCVFALILLALAFHFFDRRRHVRLQLSQRSLTVRGDIYRHDWPLSSLIINQARMMDLNVENDFRPRWKLWGTSMSGYHSGQFRLRNKRTATVFLSAMDSVVMVPRLDGSAILLSVGEDFLSALQEAALPAV